MRKQTIPYFLIKWIKDNLDHYQYLSEPAKAVRDRISKIELNQDGNDEYQVGISSLYWNFVDLVEKNPLGALNKNGLPAEILADDFLYYFLASSEEENTLYYPMDLILHLGGAGTRKRAEELNTRLLNQLELWKSQLTEYKNKKINDILSGSSQVEQLYGKLLNKSTLVVRIMLLMQFLFCGIGGYLVFQVLVVGHKTDLITYRTLSGIAFLIASFLLILSVARLFSFLAMEKTRAKYIKAWREREKEKGENNKEPPVEFRKEEGLKRIIDKMLFQGTYQPLNQTMGSTDQNTEEQLSLKDFLDPKMNRVFNTIRPVHLLVSGLACICLYLIDPMQYEALMGDIPYQYLEKSKDYLDSLEKYTFQYFKENISKEEITTLVSMQQMNVKTKKKKVNLYDSMTEGADIIESMKKGTELQLLSIETTEGVPWFRVMSESEGYIRTEDARLIDKKKTNIEKVEIVYVNGKREITDTLTDGKLSTGIRLKKGDRISITLESTTQIAGIYIQNGLAENAYVAGITEALLKVAGNGYGIRFDKKIDPSGYFIGFPKEKVLLFDIEIQNGMEDAGITELFVYPAV